MTRFSRLLAATRMCCCLLRWSSLVAAIAACSLPVAAQTMKAPDITQTPTLYVVPYAHLDTQWRWEFPQSISEFLLKTMRVNFDYMDKYPHYVFNWSVGSRPVKDHAGELRLHGQISALRLQLVGSQPVPPDVGVLPSRLRADATVCRQRSVVSGRVVSGGRGREPSQCGRHFPPDSVWQ